MSQSITDVQEGLYNHLLTTPNFTLDVQRENERYEPNVRDDWSRVTLLPGSTTRESLGKDGFNRLNGLYQIDLFTPSGRKDISAINMVADGVINNYINQIFIHENTTNIRVIDCWRDIAIAESDWFQLPIYVRWESYQQRAN